MTKTVFLFIGSILLTAVFSYSLNRFMREDLLTLTLKTMLIPCFTWTMLILVSIKKLSTAEWKTFMYISGTICLTGSAILVPCGIYNFMAAEPMMAPSIISVLLCVAVMSYLYYSLLPIKGLTRYWWRAFNILITINMALFYLSTKI